eukprot:7045721-Alexandrium_andersonii.AAC.1
MVGRDPLPPLPRRSPSPKQSPEAIWPSALAHGTAPALLSSSICSNVGAVESFDARFKLDEGAVCSI